MRTHVTTVQGTFSCTGKGKLKMGSVLLSASNHSTWRRGAQKHRATVPRCSPALLRDVLQHLTPTCKAGEQRVETRTESPGRKKGYEHAKTRRQLRAGCAFFTDFTKNCNRFSHKAWEQKTTPPCQESTSATWAGPALYQPPLQVWFGWKEAGKYPKASWGANGVLVAWGVGKTLSTKGEDRHAYDWAVSLL